MLLLLEGRFEQRLTFRASDSAREADDGFAFSVAAGRLVISAAALSDMRAPSELRTINQAWTVFTGRQ